MHKSVPRVAYLSYDGLTDPLGQSQILPYILGLEEKGFEFVMISFEKAGTYMEGRSVIEGLIEKRRITWIPLMYHKSPQVLSTLLDIYFLWCTVINEHTKNPFSILHCRSYITSLVGLRMKRRTQVKFIFDMRGFWADERVEGGLWNLNNPLYKLVYQYFKNKEKEFVIGADHIVSLTENARQEILSWSITNAPITVIPTCVDLDLFNPAKIDKEKQATLRIKLGIQEDDFVLLYLGSWGTWYLTEEMLMFFSELKKQIRGAKFLILSPDKIELENCPDKSDVILSRAPRHLVPLYISLANASVFFIKPSFSKKASSATKMGEIVAMSIPVVANTGWGDVDLYEEESVILLNDFSSASVRQITSALLKMKEMSRHKGLGLTKEHPLALEKGILNYHQVYHQLLS